MRKAVLFAASPFFGATGMVAVLSVAASQSAPGIIQLAPVAIEASRVPDAVPPRVLPAPRQQVAKPRHVQRTDPPPGYVKSIVLPRRVTNSDEVARAQREGTWIPESDQTRANRAIAKSYADDVYPEATIPAAVHEQWFYDDRDEAIRFEARMDNAEKQRALTWQQTTEHCRSLCSREQSRCFAELDTWSSQLTTAIAVERVAEMRRVDRQAEKREDAYRIEHAKEQFLASHR